MNAVTTLRPVPRDRALDVLVLGSANMDLVVELERFPAPGQTSLAGRARRSPGGKGANQAVAASRSGARTALLAAFGEDADGRELRGVLSAAGVDLAAAQTVPADTGRALVFLDGNGENSIVVIAGANAELDIGDGCAGEFLTRAAIVLAQLETPLPAVLAAARQSRRGGAVFILNAAPYQPLPAELLALIDLLVVNEQEARDLAAARGDVDAVLSALLALVPAVIVTRGGAGSVFGDAAGRRHPVGSAEVAVVDTTGAGDTYCGVLAAALARGVAVDAAMALASDGAALCVTRPGAITAIPTAAEIESWRAAERSDHG